MKMTMTMDYPMAMTEPDTVYLDELVSRILKSFQPVAVKHQSIFVNEIPHDLAVNTDEQLLAAVIGDLCRTIAAESRNNCIRVSARNFHNVVLFHFRKSGEKHAASSSSLQKIQPLAEKLGGCITLNHIRNESTLITFSFLNTTQAA